MEQVQKLLQKLYTDVIYKFAEKFGTFFWAIPAIAILLLAFVIGLALSFGGDLGKFKKVAKSAIGIPTNAHFQATAKAMPIAVRKQYKEVKQTGKKPSDVITLDACVYTPYQVSGAARFPSLMTAFGVFAVMFVFGFAELRVVDYISVLIVILLALVFRLIAGIVSRCILSSGVKTYNAYVAALDNYLKVQVGGEQEQAPTPEFNANAEENPAPAAETYNASGDIPFASADEPIKPTEFDYGNTTVVQQTPVYGSTFEPERIEVTEIPEEPVVMAPPTETEAEIKARARAEAMARARAEQAQRAQAAQAQPQPQPQPQPKPQPKPQAQFSFSSSSSANDVIARIDKITKEGAPLSTMKEVALQLQKERAKPENKTPDMQRKLNEALAALLKAMSNANKK